MITLIQLGNESLHTLEGALRRMGFGCCRAERPDQAAPLGPIILMGTGPLDPASLQLKNSGWWRDLPQMAADGRPVLGINLGLHLLAEGSEESPRGSGLGLIPGIVRRLGPGVKDPHWGWSPVRQLRDHPLFPDIRGGWLFFAHSHALEPTSETLSVAVHGRPFSVMECRGRAVGIQAHLEKSSCFGLSLLAQTLKALGEQPDPELTAELN
jgi:imidazole glycerol phosphate synthase glutamine amidotransferase subunit